MPFWVAVDVALGRIISVQEGPTIPENTAERVYHEIPAALWRQVFSDASVFYEWRTSGGGGLNTRQRPGYDPNVG